MKTSNRKGKCYICENECLLTKHHIIPQRYKIEVNKTVGLCSDCHELLNRLEGEDSKMIVEMKVEISTLNEKLLMKHKEIERLKLVVRDVYKKVEKEVNNEKRT